ncbi:MAG: hypothetical protein MUP03_07030, partial [Anaerolineales bacterium]|nr:hypothetical protein [Anaerolineales bacterium]
ELIPEQVFFIGFRMHGVPIQRHAGSILGKMRTPIHQFHFTGRIRADECLPGQTTPGTGVSNILPISKGGFPFQLVTLTQWAVDG